MTGEKNQIEESAFSKLKKLLSEMAQIPPFEWVYFLSHLKIKRIKKGELYFHQGEYFDEMGFIVDGLMYNFYTNESGDEHVKVILENGKFVAPYSTIIKNKISPFSSRAVHNTLLVTLKYKDLLTMYERHKCWERIGRKAAEELFARKEEREYQFLILDAKTRYENFVKDYQHCLHLIPQNLIASYIGINPASLSRLRKKQ